MDRRSNHEAIQKSQIIDWARPNAKILSQQRPKRARSPTLALGKLQCDEKNAIALEEINSNGEPNVKEKTAI